MSMANMTRSETTEQMGLFRWANNHVHVLPELRWMYHVPNEGKRTNGNILKAAGLKSGVPDICLPLPRNGYHGLYIEMKYGKNKATKEQKEYLAALDEYGYKTAICYGAQEAMETIVDYLQTPDGQNLYVCLDAPWIGGCCCGKCLRIQGLFRTRRARDANAWKNWRSVANGNQYWMPWARMFPR